MKQKVSPTSPPIQFHPLTYKNAIALQELIRASESETECRADISLAYLITYWKLKTPPLFAKVNNNYILNLYDIEQSSAETAIIGSNKLKVTIEEVFASQAHSNVPAQITLATEAQIKLLEGDVRFNVSPDHDLDEYILDVDLLTSFNHPHLRTFRQAVEKFDGIYSTDRTIRLEQLSYTTETISRVINTLHSWERPKQQNDPLGIEKKYLEEMLRTASQTNLQLVGLFDEDKLIGFCMYTLSEQKKFCLAHVIKVDYSFTHSFDYFLHAFAKYMKTQGYKYINAEEDMGVPGIRFKKQHLAPVKMLRRYTITPGE